MTGDAFNAQKLFCVTQRRLVAEIEPAHGVGNKAVEGTQDYGFTSTK